MGNPRKKLGEESKKLFTKPLHQFISPGDTRKHQHPRPHFLKKEKNCIYISKSPNIWDVSCLTCHSRFCAFLLERSDARWWRGDIYTNCRPFSSDWSHCSGKDVCPVFVDTAPHRHLQGEAALYGVRSYKWVQPHQLKRYSRSPNRTVGSYCQGTNPWACTTYCGRPGLAHHWWHSQ